MLIFHKLRQALGLESQNKPASSKDASDSISGAQYNSRDDDYPVWPPEPPEAILAQRDDYWRRVTARKFAAPRGQFEDSPLNALYRLYECFVLDLHIPYRNLLEYFWRQHQWRVAEIPDPQDANNSRYAFLAGVTFLIVRSFNERVSLGLTREGSGLMSYEEHQAAKKVPHEQRSYEKVPKWADEVSPLSEMLNIQSADGTILEDEDDKRADPDFLKKNILIWTPQIHFT